MVQYLAGYLYVTRKGTSPLCKACLQTVLAIVEAVVITGLVHEQMKMC